MAAFVHAQEAEVAVLAHLAVLGAVDDKGRVAGGGEFGFVSIVDGEGDGLAAEPVADVVGVAVVESNADAVGENGLEVRDEHRVVEVAGFVEAFADKRRGVGGVVEVYTKGLLHGGLVEVVYEILRWGGVCVRVADVVDTAAGVSRILISNSGSRLLGNHYFVSYA